ncbi:hypothetical protein SynMINOS11_02053 [Synechococcus sp. Minos11]|nr:hypothetical protein SynMINOS11_02053 [Synechococcus sp. Minos11]
MERHAPQSKEAPAILRRICTAPRLIETAVQSALNVFMAHQWKGGDNFINAQLLFTRTGDHSR